MDGELVEIFSDELNLRMIASVSERPRSARELALMLRIPVSRTYRRIKRLENAGILAVRDRVPSGFGKRENLYESRLRTFEILYEVGAVHVNCVVEGREPIRVDEVFRDEIMTKLQTPWTESAEAPLTQSAIGGPSPMA
jgi:DNA-binding Lrp family transcriptional regulator